jgi:predicted XRE-type DNA-binding protein
MANKKNWKRFITPSSGNVFADLGLPDAGERKTKLRLAFEINQIIEEQGLSQIIAAHRLKINQPKISALANYRLEGFSVERLMNFLTALDRDVHIAVRRKRKSAKMGRILVTAA